MTSLLGLGVHAAAYRVEARTEAQMYQIRSFRGADPTDPVLLPRRRVVQYLGLDGYELMSKEDFGFESSLRVYTDFGLPRGEAARIDGLRSEDLDILFANLFFRRGGAEARLGRQYFIDIMDYMAFDGLRVRYVLPFGLGAEAYGGLWVKGGALLGSSVYQPDGIRETDERRVALGDPLADPVVDDLQPVYGAKLLARNLAHTGVSGSAGYRASTLGGRTDLERASVELQWDSSFGVHVFSGMEYDLLLGRPSTLRAQVRYDQNLYALSGEFMRFAPTFSSYSIFYYFATAARDELRLRGDYLPRGPFRFYAQVLTAEYGLNLKEGTGLAAVLAQSGTLSGNNVGAGAGGQYRQGNFRSALDVIWRNGYGGRQTWVDLTAGWTANDRRLSVDGRLSYANIADGLNPLLTGHFYGAQGWGTLALSQALSASLVLEQNFNPFTESDTKVFAVLDFKALVQ